MESNTQLMTVKDMKEVAADIAKSRLFAMEQPEQIFALMMICQSEGLHPIQALKRYHIIEGRPSMRADAMQAEFQRQGGTLEWVESTDEACEAIFSHASSPKPFRLRVTLKQYIDSGVAMGWDKSTNKQVVKKNWRQFPAAMLRARVISSGVRAVLPGVVAGIYTPEEVQDFENPPTDTAAATPKTVPAATAAATKKQDPVVHSATGKTGQPNATPEEVVQPAEPSSVIEAEFAPATEESEDPDCKRVRETYEAAHPEAPAARSLPAGVPDAAPTVYKDQLALARLLKGIMPPEEHDALRGDLNRAANDGDRAKILQKTIDGMKGGF